MLRNEAARGATLVELAIVLAFLGVVTGIAVPRFLEVRDRVAADAAATSAVALLSTARHAAIRHARVTAVRFDSTTATITVFSTTDTLERRSLAAVHGVIMSVTRDSIAYSPNGMGYGAANTRVILTRGAAAETLTVSRLGRVRR